MSAYRHFAAVYDRLMEEMPYPEWMSFARRCWNEYGMPKTVVDLGCGTGNMAIPLARSGFSVFGIDQSSEMLSIALGKWEQPPPRRLREEAGTVRWLQQDMRDWDIPEPVDAVISFCDCFNYLTEPQDVTAAIRQTYAGLAPGGLFLFDVHAPKQLERYAEEQPFIYDEKDLAYIWTCEYDSDRSEIEHSLTFFIREENAPKSGSSRSLYSRFEESHVQRAYDPDWLAGQLVNAGFDLLHRCADFTWDKPNENSERLFFVARKPE
jgi:SAM-dependent methyltransferase